MENAKAQAEAIDAESADTSDYSDTEAIKEYNVIIKHKTGKTLYQCMEKAARNLILFSS